MGRRMWRLCLRRLLVFGFLTATGGWLSATGWQAVGQCRRLDAESAVVEGRVIDAATRELSKGGQSSTLRVTYHPAGGSAITRDIDVDGTTYRKALETRIVEVSYLPQDPRISRITRFAPLPHGILAGFGAAMVLAGLAGTVFLIVKRT